MDKKLKNKALFVLLLYYKAFQRWTIDKGKLTWGSSFFSNYNLYTIRDLVEWVTRYVIKPKVVNPLLIRSSGSIYLMDYTIIHNKYLFVFIIFIIKT